MGPIWGPPGSCRPQMDPMLAPWTLLSGQFRRNGVGRYEQNQKLEQHSWHWWGCDTGRSMQYWSGPVGEAHRPRHQSGCYVSYRKDSAPSKRVLQESSKSGRSERYQQGSALSTNVESLEPNRTVNRYSAEASHPTHGVFSKLLGFSYQTEGKGVALQTRDQRLRGDPSQGSVHMIMTPGVKPRLWLWPNMMTEVSRSRLRTYKHGSWWLGTSGRSSKMASHRQHLLISKVTDCFGSDNYQIKLNQYRKLRDLTAIFREPVWSFRFKEV